MTFDPFENRTSRDIRNHLSQSFLLALKTGDASPFLSDARALKQKAPDPAHRQFIDERIRRCTAVLSAEKSSGKDTPHEVETAFAMWSRQLFFECHEWLEAIWRDAQGPGKKAILGLVRSAGAFALFEAGRLAPARSSARKACALLREYRVHVPLPFRPEAVIKALEDIIQTG